jgi:peptidoglycan/LPS O-acetylase OafA/YrhL
MVLFPLVIWLAMKLEDQRTYRAVVAMFVLALAYCTGMFATWHFVA